MRALLALLLWAPAWAWAACTPGPGANAWTAADCSATEVDLCIVASSAGDAINVPAGAACNWSGLDTLTGRSLIGAGSDTGGTVVATNGITLTKHATHNTRLSGVRFTSTSGVQVTIGGTYTNKPVIVDNSYFNIGSGIGLFDINTTGVLIHSSEFVGVVDATPDDKNPINLGAGSPSSDIWAADPTIGQEDDGEGNIYFEDNIFTNLMEVAWDCDNGAPMVFRFNLFTDSGVVLHGGRNGEAQDTSSYGCRFAEFVGNTFDRVTNAAGMGFWVHWRGHGGSFVLNTLDNADSPDGSSYPNKPEIKLGVGCDGGSYPRGYQVGQIVEPVSNPPLRPLIVTGNSRTGGSLAISVEENPNGSTPCASPSTFVQSGRDYHKDITTGVRASRSGTCTVGAHYWSTDGGGNWNTSNGAGADGAADRCSATNTWTNDWYAPYTYPHPLRSGGGPSTPSAPTNFRRTAGL